MTFEFDESKSSANKEKHGIDFIEAQAIWGDIMRLEIPAQSSTEPRFQVLGVAGDRIWSAFIAYRNNKIRIISVRRAREKEEEQCHVR